MNDWKSGKLSDIAKIVMGQSPKGENCNHNNHGMPLLNGPTEFGIQYPIPQQYTTSPTKLAQMGDILFCVRGSTTGRMNWADREYVIGRGLAAIQHKKGKEYQYFLKGILDYLLPVILTSTTGSVFPNVSRTQLENLEILIPPLPEQKAIAGVLSSLDDKIDLLQRQNKTLEALAETLFRQWFIEEVEDDAPSVNLRHFADNIKSTVNIKNLKKYEFYVGLEHIPRKNISLQDHGFSNLLRGGFRIAEPFDKYTETCA